MTRLVPLPEFDRAGLLRAASAHGGGCEHPPDGERLMADLAALVRDDAGVDLVPAGSILRTVAPGAVQSAEHGDRGYLRIVTAQIEGRWPVLVLGADGSWTEWAPGDAEGLLLDGRIKHRRAALAGNEPGCVLDMCWRAA